MHPYLKLNYDFLGLESLLDNLGFLRGSQTLTSSIILPTGECKKL